MHRLAEKVALVTGASRGVGRGIAIGLGEAGATVYVSGRSDAISSAAEEVTRAGGRGVAVQCDHADDDSIADLFARIRDEQPRLDVLTNNVWGGYERMVVDGQYTWEQPFWKQPLWRWDAMFAAGVRAHYVASRLAAPQMIEQQGGLIVNLSYWAAKKYKANVAYGVSKAATDRMTVDMAHELQPHGVTVVSLYPGLVRTEKVMSAAPYFDLTNSESPTYVGRAVAALASDPKMIEKTGRVLIAAELGHEYGFTDVDGRSPRPLTIEEA